MIKWYQASLHNFHLVILGAKATPTRRDPFPACLILGAHLSWKLRKSKEGRPKMSADSQCHISVNSVNFSLFRNNLLLGLIDERKANIYYVALGGGNLKHDWGKAGRHCWAVGNWVGVQSIAKNVVWKANSFSKWASSNCCAGGKILAQVDYDGEQHWVELRDGRW